MAKEKRVGILGPGDPFRDWLISILRWRIQDPECLVAVYRILPSSHTVCRYEFLNQGFSVVAKFYAEPTGWKRSYDPVSALEAEFSILRRLEQIIDIPRPLAMHRDFHCALLTEYVRGRSLYRCLQKGDCPYDRLTAVARVQRRLHDQTRSVYRKDKVFARFHRLLDQLWLDQATRTKYDLLLGRWWHSPALDLASGCRIHGDANPMNYLFDGERVYLLDLESSKDRAHFGHDLGLIAAELKHYFAFHRGNGNLAEPYIGHYLWQYCRDLDEFRALTRVLPFFMGLGWLRMARLPLGKEHRAYVMREAKACLKCCP